MLVDQEPSDLSTSVDGVHGVDEIEAAISGLPLIVDRLTASTGSVAFSSSAVGDVEVLIGQFGFPVTTTGDVAPTSTVVGLQLEPGDGSWNGVEFSLDRAWVYEPGSEHDGVGRASDGRRPPRFATVSLPRTAAGDGTWAAVEDGARVSALRRLVVDTVQADGAGGLDPTRSRLAERELVQVVEELQGVGPSAGVGSISAARITDECRALAAALGPVPSTAELAAGIGVSERWVRAAFQKVFGVSPSVFFRAQAIERARRELRAAAPGATSVTEVALRNGFWHLGRFAASYQATVGELPSATLGRAG